MFQDFLTKLPMVFQVTDQKTVRIAHLIAKEIVPLYGVPEDCFLSGVLWAYPNTPHESTKEKPFFLLFGIDLKSLIKAALLPLSDSECTDLTDY